MAKEIKFNVRLSVDGREQLVIATSSVDEMRKAMEQAKGSAARFRDMLIGYNQGVQMMQNLHSAISQITGTLNSVTEESRTFGAAMRAANTMAGKDVNGFAQLKDQVAGLSETIPMARDQLANGLYQVISNGVPEDNWISYLQKSARSAVGGIADVGEVVKVTSTIIKNYGLGWDAAGDIQDKIQLTAKNGVTSFEQLAQALPRVTSNAATLGVTIEELLATFATLTGVSGNTAEVSTQLAAVFTALVKPSSEAAKMAEQMAIKFDAAAIKAAGGMRNFLTDLDKQVKQYAQTSGRLEQEIYGKLFGSAESLRALIPLTGELSDKFSENTDAMANSAGTIDAAFEEMSSTGASKLQMLKNEWGKYTDWIADKVGGIQPLLNFSSQLGMTTISVLTLVEAFKKLHILQSLMSKKVLQNIAAYALFGTNTRKVAAATNVMSQSFRSAQTRAIALKIAIRGLMVTTGVGLALVALGVVLDKLIGSLDKTKDAAIDAAGGIGDLGKAADTVQEAYDNTLSSTYSDLMGKYEQLKQGWKSLSTEQEKIAWIKNNQTAFDDLRIEVNNVADAENIFNGNTDAVVEAFTRRAKAAARMAQLTELYRKQIGLADEYSRTQTSIQDDATRNGRHAKAGDLVPEGWRSDRYGRVDRDGNWHFTEQGAKLYSGTDVSSSISLRNIQNRMDANDAEIKKVESQFAAENAAAKATIKPGKHKSTTTADTNNSNKNTGGDTSTEKVLIENAKTYKDLANNVAYYQQEIEKCDITDTERIKTLIKGKATAEKAVQAFNDMTETANVPTELKTFDDYERKLQYLQKKRQTANKEAIADIDAEIEKVEAAKQVLEDESVAALKNDEIKTYDQLNKKLAYYNRLLNSGDEDQRKFAQNGINALNKLQEAWDFALEETKLPTNTNTVKDIDAAISFYNQRQQREDADQIQKTQVIIDQLTAKKKTLQLGIELPQMQREIADIDALTGREHTLKIRGIGFDELTNKIKELKDLLSDTQNPVTDNQREEIESMIATYEKWRKQSISSFDTMKNGWSGIKGIGDSVQSITDALEGNGNAWQTVTAIVDGFIQLYESIQTIVGIINLLTAASTAHTAAKTAEGTATGVAAGATVAAAETEAAAAATIPVIAANKLATASYMELASAMYFAAHASIPFAGFGIAAGFVSEATAMVQAIGVMPFANGGVVSGPTLALVGEYAGATNNPEVIAPLDKLRSMMQPVSGVGGTVRFEIDGRKLVGVIANETRISSKSGRRTNIKV